MDPKILAIRYILGTRVICAHDTRMLTEESRPNSREFHSIYEVSSEDVQLLSVPHFCHTRCRMTNVDYLLIIKD